MPERIDNRLRADCARCAGLCCVAPALAASADFAIDKPAGRPCPNLRPDFRCGIHGRLRGSGFPGCAVYDCFGAGQQVVQHTFGGRDWLGEPRMFAVFAVMRQLHELLWYLTAALDLPAAAAVHDRLRDAREETERLTFLDADRIVELAVPAHRDQVNVLLREASRLVRGDGGPDHAGADLIGADLTGTDLRAANLRGAYLVGADLRGVNLDRADVTGADLRGAKLAGADLRGTIFLTQAQLDAAHGDDATRVPGHRNRPDHWEVR